MSTLYELTGEYLQLLEMLEDADSLEERVIRDTLGGIGGELEVKADGYAKIIRELTAEAEKFGTEKKRLEERQTALEGRVKLLKESLFNAMRLTGKEKFRTELFSFGIQNNGGKKPVEFVPDVRVPDEYTRREPDNEKIREALESGKTLTFAVLRERGQHLRIR